MDKKYAENEIMRIILQQSYTTDEYRRRSEHISNILNAYEYPTFNAIARDCYSIGFIEGKRAERAKKMGGAQQKKNN